MEKIDFNGIAHEIWATAQLNPQEGIEDGVCRIETLLIANFKRPSNTQTDTNPCDHCDNGKTIYYARRYAKYCVHCGRDLDGVNYR